MAYSVKYLFKFESSNGTTREIRVLQDGYTGEVIQRPLGRSPVLKKQQNGPVHGTSLEFYAECHVDREFIEFYTSDPKAYRVDLYAGATLLWRGYITPELYSEPDIAPPYDVQVVATDGVGELKLYDYAAQGTVTLRTLLSGLLSRTGLGTDIYLISSLKAGSRGAGALLDMTINLDYMAGESCYDVLTYLLDTLHATITWWKGAWILTRETNVTFTSGKVRYFNTAGNSALLADSVQTLGSLRANPAWPVGQLSTVIDPAKNRVTVQAPWHVVTCLRNSDMGSDADWTKAKNARYETDGYVLPININTGTSETAVISQATSMAGLRVPMNLSVKATGATSEISAQVTGAVLGVLLTYKVGNVTYHLVKGDDGVPVWQQGDDIGTYIPLRTHVDFQQQLATWDSSRIEAEELTIDNIPPFLQGTTFPAGTLTVYILGYCAKIYGAYLDVVLPKGYQDILRIDNGARGEGSEVEIAIGRETTDNAYYAAFLQGLLLDSGNLITSFSDANFPAGMDYLAFIVRDYALSVALPRAKVTGTVYLESGIAAPPLVFTKGALNYWLQTWSWNLYEDELEIEGLTLPSASLTVESETILESNGSTVSSAGGAGSSSAGSSMGGGVGTNYWEIDGTLNALVKPKDAYAYVHSKDGLFFTGAALSGTVVPDLYVDVVNNQRVLRSPLPLITGGDQIVIDGTPGGGGGGGGATTLAGLDDTNITNPQAGQMLSWNGTKWVNTNAPTGSITSVSLAAGASNGTLHLVVNGTAQSDVAVTGLKALAYKDSLAFSEITGTASASQIPTLAISKISGLQTALDGKQPLDADLTAIAGLTGTSGFLKKTAANTWALDTNTYLTTGTAASTYQPLDSDLTAIAAISTGTGLLKRSVSGSTVSWTIDTNTYLTGITSTMVTNALGYTPANVTALADYVKLTSAGQQVISVTGATDTPVVFKSGLENASWIGFRDSANTILGYIGMTSTDGPAVYVGGAKKIWHAGNLTLASLAGNTAKGSTSLPIYYTGSALAPITDLDLLSQSTGNVKANRVYLTSSIYFYTETVGGTVCVRLNAPFITAGDQIVISGTPGGGGGGGATTLAGLDDVAITSVANGQLLQYNGSKWVNVAASSVGGVTSVAGYTGAVTAAQIATALTGAGYKLTDTTYTNGTGISLSGTTFSLNVSGAKTALGLKALAYKDSLAASDIPDLSGTYLPLTGGTIKNGTATEPLNIDSNSTGSIGMYFRLSGVNKAWVGYMNNGYGATIYSSPSQKCLGIKDDGTPHYQGNTLWHAGNFVAGTNYVTPQTTLAGYGITDWVVKAVEANSPDTFTTAGIYRVSTQSGTTDFQYGQVLVLRGTSSSDTITQVAFPYNSNNIYFRKGTTSNFTSDAWKTILNSANYTSYINTTNFPGLNGNQTITLSGDVSGSGATSIAVSIGQGKVTNAMLAGSIANGKLANSSITINGSSTSLGGSFSTASITAGTAGQSTASSGVSFSVPYVTMNAYGIVTGYGTHTHTISAQDLYDTIGSTKYAPYNANGYLPLTGGTIRSASSYARLRLVTDATIAYVQAGTSDGNAGNLYLSGFNTGVGSNLYLKFGNIYATGSNYTVYHSGNSNSTSVDWRAKNLTVAYNSYLHFLNSAGDGDCGYIIGYRGVSGNTLSIHGSETILLRTGGTTAIQIDSSQNVGIGTTSPSQKLDVAGAGRFYGAMTSGISLYLHNTTTASSWIQFGHNNTVLGWVGVTNAYSIVVQNASGTNVMYVNTSGTLTTTGDQVVSSDATLKENLTPVTYSVSDIAKARAVEFDWKDGRGHSMGSIAQDWLGIAPALVHGEEGNMSLAYGQLALVNTIIEAREIETLKARVAELEAEVKRLRMN